MDSSESPKVVISGTLLSTIIDEAYQLHSNHDFGCSKGVLLGNRRNVSIATISDTHENSTREETTCSITEYINMHSCQDLWNIQVDELIGTLSAALNGDIISTATALPPFPIDDIVGILSLRKDSESGASFQEIELALKLAARKTKRNYSTNNNSNDRKKREMEEEMLLLVVCVPPSHLKLWVQSISFTCYVISPEASIEENVADCDDNCSEHR